VRYQRDLQSSSLVSLRLTCSEARIGISPMTLRNSCIACLISAKRQRRACTHGETSDAPVAPSQYSPTIHMAPRNTLPDLISPKVEMSFSVMADRSAGNFSTTSLCNVSAIFRRSAIR
jgi:hypothetical protein